MAVVHQRGMLASSTCYRDGHSLHSMTEIGVINASSYDTLSRDNYT